MEPLDSNPCEKAPSSPPTVEENTSPKEATPPSSPFDIVVVLLLVGLYPIVQPFLDLAYGTRYEFAKSAIQSCVQTISSQIPLLVLVLYLMSRSGQSWSAFGVRRSMTLTDWAIASVVIATDLFFSRLIMDFSNGIFGSSQEIEFAKPRSFRDLPFTVIEMLVIGFSEEFVWRSYLQTRFREWLRSRWQAVFVVTVLFGSIHLYQGLTGVFVAMFFGLIVGGVFEWRRQIVPLALMHALLDFLLVMFQPD